MIGCDVLGLRLPFEKWGLGFCYDDDSVDSIVMALNNLEKSYETMSKNCYQFYDSVNLQQIVEGILNE